MGHFGVSDHKYGFQKEFMYIDEQFIIRSLRVLPEYKGYKNVVVGVQWDVVTNDLISSSCNIVNSTDFMFDETQPFVPYDQLTESMVRQWIMDYSSGQFAKSRAYAYEHLLSNHYDMETHQFTE